MERNIFQKVDLRSRSFLQKLLNQQPAENAVISVNNLLSTQAILNITRRDILNLEESYKVKLKEEFPLNFEEFYAVYYNECLRDLRLDGSDAKHLNHLKQILDLDEQTVKTLQTKVGMIVYTKAFENAIRNGRLSQDDKDFLESFSTGSAFIGLAGRDLMIMSRN